MMYRQCSGAEKDSIWVQYGDFYICPATERRPVDDLTDKEVEEVLNINNNAPKEKWTYCEILLMRRAILLSDSFRAKSRETEKERWIREGLPKEWMWDKPVRELMEKTWDAAYKAGKREREEV